jgi:EmrB/QacA subfamily drug resistance transporter
MNKARGDASPAPNGSGVRGSLPRGLALLVAASMFMEILDETVIAPALPQIAADFGVRAVSVNIAITAYVLAVALLIPASGWLSGRFGARAVFTTAVAVFTLASLGCAAATDLPMLTVVRVLQGVGGALMVPVGRLTVLRTTAKSDLIRAIAYMTWPALVAPVLAPAVGGVLVTYADWRWIFLLNVPFGMGVLLLARRLVPDVRETPSGELDWRGLGLTTAGVGGVVVAMEAAGSGASPSGTAGALAVGLLALAAAIRYLLRSPRPLLRLRLFAVPTFRVTAAGGSVFRAAIAAIPFLLPLLFQLGFGWTAAHAGLVVIALFFGNLAVKPLTTPLMRRFGIRPVLLGAIAASAAALLGLALVQAHTPLPLLLGLLVLSGAFRSIGFSAYNTVAFADIPAEQMNAANTLLASVQQVGGGLGIATSALVVAVGGHAADLAGLGTGAGGAVRLGLLSLALMLVIAAIEAYRLPRDAGHHVTARSRDA